MMLSPSSIKPYSKKLRDVATFLNKLTLTMDGWVKGSGRNLTGHTPPQSFALYLQISLPFNPHRDISFCNKHQLKQRPTCRESHTPSLNCSEESLMTGRKADDTEQSSHTHELSAVTVHEPSRGKIQACVGQKSLCPTPPQVLLATDGSGVRENRFSSGMWFLESHPCSRSSLKPFVFLHLCVCLQHYVDLEGFTHKCEIGRKSLWGRKVEESKEGNEDG